MLDFFRQQRPPEDIEFAVGQPFLEYLVAAKLVGPDCGRHVAPKSVFVEVHVERVLAEDGQGSI